MLLQCAVRAVASSLLSQKTACARSRERMYAAMTKRLRADLSLASARFFGARRLWWSRTRWTTSVFIFLAVRFGANGGPKNGGEPRERISLENCIRAYTSGSAYAQFEEGKKGELKQGEYADLSSFRMISPKSPRPVHQNARPPHRRRRPHGVRGSLIRRGRSSVHFLELHSPIFLRAGS